MCTSSAWLKKSLMCMLRWEVSWVTEMPGSALFLLEARYAAAASWPWMVLCAAREE